MSTWIGMRAFPRRATIFIRIPPYSCASRISSPRMLPGSSCRPSSTTGARQMSPKMPSKRGMSGSPRPRKSRSRVVPTFVGPRADQHGALEHELPPVGRLRDPIHQALEPEAGQHDAEVFAPLPGQVQQALPNGRGQIPHIARAHASICRYGVITRVMRQAAAARQISSSDARRWRHVSRSASTATSIPILLRYLKQSATVLAGP